MEIQMNFANAGALKKATPEKAEGDFIIVFEKNFPKIEYHKDKLQTPTIIGENIISSNDEYIDAEKRDAEAIIYLKDLVNKAIEEVEYRREKRELEKAENEKEKAKTKASSIFEYT